MLGFNLWGRGAVPRKCTPQKTGTGLEPCLKPCWNLGNLAGTFLELAGTFLEPCWNLACNLPGTMLEPCWNLAGTLLEPCWKVFGTFLEPSWNLAGTLLELSWNLRGSVPEPCWNSAGTLPELCRNLVETLARTSWNHLDSTLGNYCGVSFWCLLFPLQLVCFLASFQCFLALLDVLGSFR